MSRRALVVSLLACSLLTALSVAVLDEPIARLMTQVPPVMVAALRSGTAGVETLFGFEISKFAFGLMLLAGGGALWLRPMWRPRASMLLFVAGVHLVTRFSAGLLKNVFSRTRPFQDLPDFDSSFFVPDGSSFPSGHAAHFWSLFFPLALLFPRYRVPLLVLPLFISVARVGVNDHYASDVLASAAFAALVTLVASRFILVPAEGGLSLGADETSRRRSPLDEVRVTLDNAPR